MMMDGWQELSGTPTPHQRGQNLFWNNIRNNHKEGIKSDLYEGEALCAIAFVKRRFARYFGDLSGIKIPNNWYLHGWKLETGIPSVSYMAAVHWLENVMKQAQADKSQEVKQRLSDFDYEAHKLTKERGGWSNDIRCIREQVYNRTRKNSASHDGNVFFPFVLENKKLYPDQQQAKKVINAFNALNKVADTEAVSPFYAVLMMDGDNIGENLRILKNQETISEALAKFTKEVATIVDKKDGFLIYAGGDDVLAILPLEDALACARDLRDHYSSCFADTDIKTSLSGAIEYAHIKMPLTKVLHDTHKLLDKIAKEQTGRDALAVRVWKPGGTALEWSQPWDTIIKDGRIVMQELVENFRAVNTDDTQFSNKFFHKIREHFDLLNPVIDPNTKKPKKRILTEEQAISLMAMEYINSSSNRNKDMQTAKDEIEELLTQCRPNYRNKQGKCNKSDYLYADGALLLRFLAQKGVE